MECSKCTWNPNLIYRKLDILCVSCCDIWKCEGLQFRAFFSPTPKRTKKRPQKPPNHIINRISFD